MIWYLLDVVILLLFVDLLLVVFVLIHAKSFITKHLKDHILLATRLKPQTSEMNNMDHLVTIQWSAG